MLQQSIGYAPTEHRGMIPKKNQDVPQNYQICYQITSNMLSSCFQISVKYTLSSTSSLLELQLITHILNCEGSAKLCLELIEKAINDFITFIYNLDVRLTHHEVIHLVFVREFAVVPHGTVFINLVIGQTGQEDTKFIFRVLGICENVDSVGKLSNFVRNCRRPSQRRATTTFASKSKQSKSINSNSNQ